MFFVSVTSSTQQIMLVHWLTGLPGFRTSLELFAYSDLRHGREFECNQEDSLVRSGRPLTDFKLHLAVVATCSSGSVDFPMGKSAFAPLINMKWHGVCTFAPRSKILISMQFFGLWGFPPPKRENPGSATELGIEN